jgi:hypothetical protein
MPEARLLPRNRAIGFLAMEIKNRTRDDSRAYTLSEAKQRISV